MATCTRCNNSLNVLEQMTLIGKPKICHTCEGHINSTIQRLQQQVMQASAQNMLTEQFCAYIRQDLATNGIPYDRGSPLLQQLGHLKHLADMRLSYLKHLADIRQGHLPMLRVDVILDTDEQAHFDTSATYYKPNKQVRYIEGRLIATNKKLYFITPDRDSMKVDWNNVVNVNERPGMTPTGQNATLMHIQVSKDSGGGFYYVPDPTLAVAIIETAVRMWKRHLVELKENPNTQGVPEHVKAAVFQRYGGRCRQCGYAGPYIEYDHIMPRSKGGPNTIENIQILCRQCNLRKGNRV